MPSRLPANELRRLAVEAGLTVIALAGVDRIVGRLDRLAWPPVARPGTETILPALRGVLPEPSGGSILACAVGYASDAIPDRSSPPRGEIAEFARRDYYAATVQALRRVARAAGERLAAPKSAFRIFVNSRIPEKPIAYAAGLGAYGRNRLLFNDAFGSRFVIGLLFLPCALEGEGDEPALISPDEFCGPCRACLAACPVNALADESAGLPLCLKRRSDALAVWDEATRRAWGRRLYGCDTCQGACPKDRDPAPGFPTEGGAIGPGIDLAFLLSLTEDECRAHFKKTALGLSWIEPQALLRNALCAAGNSGARELLQVVRKFIDDRRPLLADMARWAQARIQAGE